MNRKGFTLIELMIVIAIILILAAIVIPNAVMIFGGGGTSVESNIEVRDQKIPEVVDQQKEPAPESQDVKSIEGENKKL